MTITAVRLSTLSAFLMFSFSAHSFIKDLALGLGTQTQFVGKVQTDETGSTNKFEFNPYLSAAGEVSISDHFSFMPEAAFLIPDKTRDSKISKMSFFVLGMFGYEINDWILRAGVGLQMTTITSDGGEQVLDNGNGQTSFPMPTQRATSRNVIINLGTEYFFHNDWSTRVDSTIYNPANSRNRAFGYQMAVHYHFHDIFSSSKKIAQPEMPPEDTW